MSDAARRPSTVFISPELINGEKMNEFDMSRVFQTLQMAGRLKTLRRTGWVQRGITDPESVADHSYRVILMTLFLAPPELDKLKIVEMAILHDLAECEVGDITPQCPEYQEKSGRELRALHELLEPFPDKDRFLELWEEFEKGHTAEARFVREIDRLEAALQAGEYARIHPDLPSLKIFLSNAEQAVSDPLLRKLLAEIAVCWP